MKKLLVCLIIICSHFTYAEDSTVSNPPTDEVKTESIAVTEQAKVESETQIPVQLEKPKAADATGMSAKKAMFGFIIVAIMALGGMYLVRKYRFSNRGKNSVNQIKVLTQHYLGPKKSLAIVRVAGESILIGVTDSNISMIKSLSLLDEDIPETTPNQFESVFSSKNSDEPSEAIDEEFAISGIKDFVSSKLKNMRSI